MRSLLLMALVASVAVTEPSKVVKTMPIDEITIERQYKILELLEAIEQVNPHSEYYKVGKDYDLMANIYNYTNKKVVKKVFWYYFHGHFEFDYGFSIFIKKMREEAIALYNLFINAQGFETFYKTASWARVYLNKHLFAYTFYIAVIQRPDTKGLVLPAAYEVWPQFFANMEVYRKMFYTKARGYPYEEYPKYGMVEDGDQYVIFANYSDYHTYNRDEHKLSYLTEDIGWNTYYNFFHSKFPFWQKEENLISVVLKESRGEHYYYSYQQTMSRYVLEKLFSGDSFPSELDFWQEYDKVESEDIEEKSGEIYYYFYQQLLARYLLERFCNNLGWIPEFSWTEHFKYGFYPPMIYYFYPFTQRSTDYNMQTDDNKDDLEFVQNYEKTFLTWLERGNLGANNNHNSEPYNYVGNFWEVNIDRYQKVPETLVGNYSAYEHAARRILGRSTWTYKKNIYTLSALDFYQTSLRDPAFYQIHNRILGFIYKYKQRLQPYTEDDLQYVGVKVKDVQVSELTTFFDYFKFNASNAVYYSDAEFAAPKKSFMVAQPRLNHQPFIIKINVKSEIDEIASFKVFIGPKFDGKREPIKIEDNWQNFVELDWFEYNLTVGENVIERESFDFMNFKEDSSSIAQIYTHLTHGEIPKDMSQKYDRLPRRLMLPRGTEEGFPLQFFVFGYKSEVMGKKEEKPLGYPLDRPVPSYFKQPNMFFKDVLVHHRNKK